MSPMAGLWGGLSLKCDQTDGSLRSYNRLRVRWRTSGAVAGQGHLLMSMVKTGAAAHCANSACYINDNLDRPVDVLSSLN